MTRACLHFIDGDILGAFSFHPLFWLVPVLFAVVVFRRRSFVKKIYDSRKFWLGGLLLVLGVYVLRMYMYFPNQVPMDFDAKALIPRVIAHLF
ncbi:hypothetical protein A5886_001302 [Enterococcus sp. 8G7_MSG3316]|uniref:Uncharacterized protein n=2 Tax=Candidatus Enterococcus testudinis TaxID=1834191 RepID=A0A242A5B2_9ENTE|nr:hypothetical protein A5886_001302 [Enterococcus sp. 8G7_MSG3316]